tara:strand:+ start:419 stop:574 length:156 start_codon:yes stop_codon:yes gene_type:complete
MPVKRGPYLQVFLAAACAQSRQNDFQSKLAALTTTTEHLAAMMKAPAGKKF